LNCGVANPDGIGLGSNTIMTNDDIVVACGEIPSLKAYCDIIRAAVVQTERTRTDGRIVATASI